MREGDRDKEEFEEADSQKEALATHVVEGPATANTLTSSACLLRN